jgi:hypothetical protein
MTNNEDKDNYQTDFSQHNIPFPVASALRATVTTFLLRHDFNRSEISQKLLQNLVNNS